LILLLGLAGITGLLLPSLKLINPGQDKRVFIDLDDARIALLAYSTNYVDHYGARGAGLGHLPCPDTDGEAGFESGNRSKDGPNPPCGQKRVAAGWLPRHLNVTEGRYVFHSQSRQRLLYAVSSAFINNPSNRIVNPDTQSTFQFYDMDGVIAVIAAVEDSVEITNLANWWKDEEVASAIQALNFIQQSDILIPVMRRVGSWLVRKFNSALDSYCDQQAEPISCDYSLLQLEHCKPTREQAILHWWRPTNAEPDCADFSEDLKSRFSFLEDVPYNQHWFVRNGWQEFINILIDEVCMKDGSSRCRFILDAVQSDEPFINIKLLRVK